MRKMILTLLIAVVAVAAVLEVRLTARQHQRLEREMSGQTPHAG